MVEIASEVVLSVETATSPALLFEIKYCLFDMAGIRPFQIVGSALFSFVSQLVGLDFRILCDYICTMAKLMLLAFSIVLAGQWKQLI